MIAKNFMKYPEALRFQRELFSNGYHNSPRIMRLMQCVFDWTPTTPDWWKEAKGRARDLARRVKKSITDFFKDMTVTTKTNIQNCPRTNATQMKWLIICKHRSPARGVGLMSDKWPTPGWLSSTRSERTT